VKAKRRPTVVVGKATNKKMKAVATKRKVNVFVSRLSPDTSVNDVRSCAAETFAEVCGAMLPDDCLKCEQLETHYQTYASYWVSFAVDPGLYDIAVRRSCISVCGGMATWCSGQKVLSKAQWLT